MSQKREVAQFEAKKHTSVMYLLASKRDHAPSTTTQSQSPLQGQHLIYVKCLGGSSVERRGDVHFPQVPCLCM